MMKKILIGIVILGAIATAVIGFGTYKVADEVLKEKEPQLRQYMQLDEAAKKDYILTHLDEILAEAKIDATNVEKDDIERYERIKNEPAFQQATFELGRSLMAKAIMHSDAIVKDMSDSVKAEYKSESDKFSERLEKYSNIAEELEAKLGK